MTFLIFVGLSVFPIVMMLATYFYVNGVKGKFLFTFFNYLATRDEYNRDVGGYVLPLTLTYPLIVIWIANAIGLLHVTQLPEWKLLIGLYWFVECVFMYGAVLCCVMSNVPMMYDARTRYFNCVACYNIDPNKYTPGEYLIKIKNSQTTDIMSLYRVMTITDLTGDYNVLGHVKDFSAAVFTPDEVKRQLKLHFDSATFFRLESDELTMVKVSDKTPSVIVLD